MTVTFSDPVSTTSRFGPDGVARNGNGQYLVLPDGGKKPVGYSRATTLAKLLDDTTNLEAWKLRTAAEGLTARPDLFSLLQVADFDDKKTINELMGQALDAGGATVRRNQGTALHGVFEKHWTDPSFTVPAAHVGDIQAVETALAAAGLELCGWHEIMVVNDAEKIAGKFDLLVHQPATGKFVVGDLKTGGSVDFGGLAFAVQLHIYASADCAYAQGPAENGSQDERTPLPAGVDQDRGLIIHVEPGSAHCELHWVDLTLGAEALEVALEVRKLRNRGRRALTRIDRSDPTNCGLTPATPLPEVPDRRTWLVERVRRIMAAEAAPEHLAALQVPSAAFLLAGWWPTDVPYLSASDEHTEVQLDAIAERCTLVETHLALPFPEPDPRTLNSQAKVDGDRVTQINARIWALPDDLQRIGRALEGRTTEAEYADLTAAVDQAELEHAARKVEITDLLNEVTGIAGAPDAATHACTLVSGYPTSTYTARDVELLGLVVEAIACGYLGASADGIVATDACEALLIKVFGGRGKALTACKAACKAREFRAPAKFIDVLAHPILIALTIGAPAPAVEATETVPGATAAA